METRFMPVDPDYYDLFKKEQEKESSTVVYFGEGTALKEEKGKIKDSIKKDNSGEYLVFNSGVAIRIDRLITINGIPGPAYGEYDGYALACLDCNVIVY